MEENSRYPFEFLFTDGTRSYYPQRDKKIWGVIIGYAAICLKIYPEKVDWFEAQSFCRGLKVGGYSCSAGSRDFWKYVINLDVLKGSDMFCQLNDLLKAFGGDPLDGEYWTSDKMFEIDGKSAWFACFFEPQSFGYFRTSYTSYDAACTRRKTRPVCLLYSEMA